MWSSSSSSASGWFSGVESAKASFQQALEKTGDALEKTGDVLTQAATNAGRQARATAAQEKKQEQEKAKGRYASVDEKPSTAAATTVAGSNNNNLLQSFQSGWSSVVESTKAGLLQAQQLVEEQQELLQQKMSGQIQPRDPSLPLDVAALQDANVVYLTDRILTLSHPAMASDTNGDITGRRKLAAVAHLLHKRHAGRFMIWNLSEVEYSDSAQAPRNNSNDKALPSVEEVLFDNQVLNYSFPGSPSPPLGLLLKLLVSLESWLRADAQNVAVIHCLTGKGRTSTVVAAFLCWMRQAGFSDVHETLAYIADCKQVSPVTDLTIPSQRRYATYFQNLLDQSIRPSQPPLLLKRVVLNQAPKFARGPGHASTSWDEEAQYWGCVPYLQLFKGGKLLFTAPATPSAQHVAEKQQREQKQAAAEQAKQEKEEKSEAEKEKEGEDSAAATKPASEGASREAKPSEKKTTGGNVQELPFCHGGDGSVHFDDLNQVVQGDVLLRCRHLAARGKQRISMFRAAFHTGYIGGTVLRLTKAQLDGACNDHSRFADDFYMDVIFEEATTTTTTTTAGEEGDKSDETKPTEDAKDDNDSNKKEESASAAVVTASADDVMLDRDSRFWDVIRKRQEEQKAEGDKKKEEQEEDPFWGPTVGRRRPMAHEKAAQREQAQQADATKEGGAPPPQASPAFSIGGEFDFLPSEDASPPSPQKKTTAAAVKDSLMEALTGALDDDDDDDDDAESSGMEEVVFFKEGEDDKAKAAAAAASSTKPATESGAESTPATPEEASNDDAKTETTTTKDDSADLSTADVDQLLAGADALLAADGGVPDAGDDDDDDDDLEDLETLLAQKK